MIPVFSRTQAQAFDREAVSSHRVSSLLLMENAGRGVVDAIERNWPEQPLSSSRIVIVCGQGNNGGDGFVAARHLLVRGADVDVFLMAPAGTLKGDARTHYDAMSGVGVTAKEVGTDAELRAALGSATVIVDAMFGTGLSRPIEGINAAVIEAIQNAGRPIVSIDLPSGLNADTGATLGVGLRADLTVTFGAHKLGLLTPQGAQRAGKVVVADIGVAPPRAHRLPAAWLLEQRDVARLIAPRSSSLHKNDAGHVVVFAGSRGHVGAAVMSAHGALRAGAGLVTIATWPEVADCLDGRVVEVMTVRIARDGVDAGVDEALARAKTVVIGPGFGKDEVARSVVQRIFSKWQGTSVVDADGLAMFAGDLGVFAGSRGAVVLTPHPGELGVLLGSSARDVEADRFAALASCVERSRSVTLLKGAHTIIGAPDERPVVNTSGSAALATAGSGDILAGTIGALACTLHPFEAAFAGAHLHGLAADAWSSTHGDRGLLAREIADEYPRLLGELVKRGSVARTR